MSGYREKVFAIIGVKVYAAGLYVNLSMLKDLSPWKGKSSDEVEKDSAVFRSIYECNNPANASVKHCTLIERGLDKC